MTRTMRSAKQAGSSLAILPLTCDNDSKDPRICANRPGAWYDWLEPNMHQNTAPCLHCGGGVTRSPEDGRSQRRKYCSDQCRDYRTPHPRAPYGERFAARLVPSGECLEFGGHRNQHGYGVIQPPSGGTQLAHRFAWAEHNKREIPVGMVIMHSCDNPPCCNPAHLVLATQADNMRDRDDKGRTLQGTDCKRAKYGPEVVAEVRRLSSEGVPQRAIREATGVSVSQISYIVNFKSRRIA